MNQNENTVDIVIPTYNSAHFILRAIRSTLNQTRLPNSIIVVDDCSIDNTVDIVKRFKSKSRVPINLIELDENRGPSFARNKGASLSNADWLLFLDSDDELHPNMIEEILQYYKENQYNRLGMVYSRHRYVEEDTLKVIVSRTELIYRNIFINGVLTLPELLDKIDSIVIGSFLIKNEVIRKTGGFDTNLRIGEDWDLYLRVMDLGYSIICLDKVLCTCYFHDNNTSRKIESSRDISCFINKWIKIIVVSKVKRGHLREKLIYLIVNKLPVLSNYFWLLSNISRKNLKLLFGNYNYSYEISVIREVFSIIKRKIKSYLVNVIYFIIDHSFLIFSKIEYQANCIIIKNGLFLKKFTFPSEDHSVGEYYKMHGYWELPMTLFLRRISRGKSNIIDVGANIGYFSSIIARSMNSGGTIYSVEANSYIVRFLRHNVNLAINESKGKTINHCVINKIAWSSDNQPMKFYSLNKSIGNSSIFKPSTNFILNKNEEFLEDDVSAISLDLIAREYNIKQVDIIRIDAEGSESEILRGAEVIIKANPSIIIICEYLPYLHVNDDYSPNNLLAQIKVLVADGFRLFIVNRLGLLKEITIELLENGYCGDVIMKK